MNKSIGTKKYYGFYRGVVREVLNNGYCRIEIPGVLEFENFEKLPPAEAAQLASGGLGDNGIYCMPDVGSNVWCFFANGDIRQPVYFAVSNPKSQKWLNVGQGTKNGASSKKGMPTKILPTGIESIYDKSKIQQEVVYDTQKDEIASTKIVLNVDRTNENKNIAATKTVKDQEIDPEDSKSVRYDVNYGPAIAEAASIEMNNGTNSLILNAAENIELNAPSIKLSAAGHGHEGIIMLEADNIVIKTNHGYIRVYNSTIKVDIRGQDPNSTEDDGNGHQLVVLGNNSFRYLS